MASLACALMEAMVTQVTTLYRHGKQKNISHPTCFSQEQESEAIAQAHKKYTAEVRKKDQETFHGYYE